MRLTAAQAIWPTKRKASQAERRRFESGHPLYSQALDLGQRRIRSEPNWSREISLIQPRGLISCKTWGPVAAIRRSPSKAAMMKRAAWDKSPCSAAWRARASSARIETRNRSRPSGEGAANEEVRAGLVKKAVISTVSEREWLTQNRFLPSWQGLIYPLQDQSIHFHHTPG
jgi:hypothetical protein